MQTVFFLPVICRGWLHAVSFTLSDQWLKHQFSLIILVLCQKHLPSVLTQDCVSSEFCVAPVRPLLPLLLVVWHFLFLPNTAVTVFQLMFSSYWRSCLVFLYQFSGFLLIQVLSYHVEPCWDRLWSWSRIFVHVICLNWDIKYYCLI